MSTSLPPFRRIARVLREDIISGRVSPGDQLASENQLAEEHSTTRATVRKAIALLRSEGLVVSEQGRGAFVRPRPRVKMLLTGTNYRANREGGLSNFNAEAAAQGHHATQELLDVSECPAPADIADRLAISVHTPVIVRRRLFVVDGSPMQFCDGYYVAELFRGTAVAEKRLIRGGVHSIIEDPQGPLRSRLSRFVEDLDIRLPLPAEAEALQIPDGVPVARVLRTAYDELGRPLEVLDSLVPTDRYSFRYVIELP
ncbi:GntR family transcriptional regulator [Allokutzneria sp. NRRL B-24872]|uniref:GntR family transcriptional regulator n=1 Tax=Allokutzneria sp. NRRL B-24872 TaxID=1137961 RepID=UPI000A373095|nr:GntR family transcriptional regulator [Allokutzneria sp. NRRL B-24872]